MKSREYLKKLLEKAKLIAQQSKYDQKVTLEIKRRSRF